MGIGRLFLIILALFVIVGPARADLSMSELQTVGSELDALSIWDEPECAAAEPDRAQIFAFEGAGGYCPRYARMNLEYAADGKTLADRLAETRETYENIPLLRRIRKLLAEETDSRMCHLARNLGMQLDKLPRSERAHRQIRYYSKDGDSKASACALASVPADARLRVVGFSMGGYAALEFARELEDAKRPIDHIVTLDPVGKNILLVSGVFFTLDNPFMKRTSNVRRWANFFQKYDWKSIYDEPFFKLGARGSRVKQADLNQQIFRRDYKTAWEIEHAHLAINLTEPVQAELETLFR